MRISDWSSDVCSSDLGGAAALLIVGGAGLAFARRRRSARALAENARTYDSEPAVTPTPVVAKAQPADAQPAEEQQWITPAYTPSERVEAPRTNPASAAAPTGSKHRQPPGRERERHDGEREEET